MSQKNKIYQFLEFLNLTHEREDVLLIHESIEKGVVFKGTNLWILVFAILIASVGLNMNSTAVIIGAMLISPLMGPINGVGYSIATYNFVLLRKSLKNFAFATSAGLITSYLYFLITPIHGEHSELLARTSPTIYDVLIAMFGGLAGIVAVTSKNKGNVIPGVAIATALMPPLCTAGYGLSIGNIGYFAGALYLFVINSVFIALASMVVSQILELPKQSHLLSREIKNKNIAVIVVTALTVIPSIYLGYTLVKQEEFKGRAEEFISRVQIWEGNYLLSKSIDAKTKKVHLVYGGNEFDSTSIVDLKTKAEDMNLEDAILVVEQGLKINDFDELHQKDSELQKVNSEVNNLKVTIYNKERSIDSLQNIGNKGDELLKEIRAIYPDIESCTYSVSKKYVDSLEQPVPVYVVVFGRKPSSISPEQLSDENHRIHAWLKKRLKSNDVLLRF